MGLNIYIEPFIFVTSDEFQMYNNNHNGIPAENLLHHYIKTSLRIIIKSLNTCIECIN